VHTYKITNVLLAGMLIPSKGGGGTSSIDVTGSETPGEASEPIGSLAEHHLSTPSFRRGGPRSWEDWQNAIACPLSPKKRKADLNMSLLRMCSCIRLKMPWQKPCGAYCAEHRHWLTGRCAEARAVRKPSRARILLVLRICPGIC
jgi:hypothetical protein